MGEEKLGMLDRAAARAALLQELTIEVTRAEDALGAASAVVRLGRALLDGVSGALWLRDADGGLTLAASDGVPDAFIAAWRRVPADAPRFPALMAAQRGTLLWVSSAEEYREVAAEIAAQAADAHRPLSFCALPLEIEGRTHGVIVFGFEAPHPFPDDEKMLALAIAGHAAQALDRARLQTAQWRALAGLRILAKVGEMLAGSLDVDETLTALARAVVPDVADWCAVDLLTSTNVRRLTAHHSDPSKVELAKAYAERFPERLDDPSSSIARIAATGEAIWVPRITPEMIDASIKDPDQLAVLHSLGLVSAVQAPLVSEGRVRGVVTFIMSESGREYDESDRDLLIEVGRRAGLAITNAELYARVQRAHQRLALVASMTAALARAPAMADVGQVACREGAAALGATTAALYIVDGKVLRLIARHADERDALEFAELSIALDLPLTRAARLNEPVIIESRQQLSTFADVPSDTRRDWSDAFMCKPLVDRAGEVVGVLGFRFDGERQITDDERALGRTLAHHCAQAFERARILDIERRARERVAILAAAGETFSSTIDYDETLRAVVGIALPSLADFGFFDILEESGDVRRTSAAHDDPEVAAILARSRWARSERTDVNLCALSSGRPALHPDIDEAFLVNMATSDEHLAVLRELRLCSMLTVPVILRGEVIGALTLCHGRSGRHHTFDDLDLAVELARRGAGAVMQARLYRAAQDAARRAEEANRVKDEFLATVSHELRTPLNAIVGWAHLLSEDRLGETGFVRRGLDVIRRNAHAQREIVDDILDVSRIITGKMRIDARPMDLAAIARDALEVVRPAAEAKGVRLELGADGPSEMLGDPARLRQVVWNLLANAVKFTDRGGCVSLAVEPRPDVVVVTVRDDGVGIAPDLLPHVFDRFRQADSSSTRTHGGLGLGLSIVRHLVEMHGGSVSAHSEGRGRGSTFEVTLPADRRAAAVRQGAAGSGATVSPPGAREGIVGLRVLIVDDDQDSRDLAALVLRDAGAVVFIASSAGEAKEIIEREAVDVLLSDIAMPDVDGYALLAMLREIVLRRGRPLRSVALTAFGRAEDRAAALRAGFGAYLSKPVEPATLVDTLRSVARDSPRAR